MPELFFAPVDDSNAISLDALQQRLTNAGLQCTIESDSPETHWIAFDPHESTIYASTIDGQVTLATVDLVMSDPRDLCDTIMHVLQGCGYSADDEMDFE